MLRLLDLSRHKVVGVVWRVLLILKHGVALAEHSWLVAILRHHKLLLWLLLGLHVLCLGQLLLWLNHQLSNWRGLSLLGNLHDGLCNTSEVVAHRVQCLLLHGLSLLDQRVLDFLDIFVA